MPVPLKDVKGLMMETSVGWPGNIKIGLNREYLALVIFIEEGGLFWKLQSEEDKIFYYRMADAIIADEAQLIESKG